LDYERVDGRTLSYGSRVHLSLGIGIMSQYGNFPLWDFLVSTTHDRPEVTLDLCVDSKRIISNGRVTKGM